MKDFAGWPEKPFEDFLKAVRRCVTRREEVLNLTSLIDFLPKMIKFWGSFSRLRVGVNRTCERSERYLKCGTVVDQENVCDTILDSIWQGKRFEYHRMSSQQAAMNQPWSPRTIISQHKMNDECCTVILAYGRVEENGRFFAFKNTQYILPYIGKTI